jgi:tape measure domain-containing protein
MTDGDIVLNLSLDDKDFAITVKNSGKVLRELRADLDKTATGVTSVQRHFGSFSTSLRHTVMSLAAVRFAAMDFYDVFLKLPSAILQTSGEIEKLTKLMGGLSQATTEAGRKNEALANTQYILDLAKKAPFEVKALADAFVKLKAGGLDPTNGSMQALTDSVARFGGTSETMHRAAVAIQQMAGKGVISMEELRQQLGEAVPTAMRMMAEGMGMSMAELTKQVSLGAVESGDALRRMFTVMEFYNRGAAAEMMDTWTGLTSRLQTEWTLLQTEIGKSGFADAAKDQLRDLIKVMSSAEGIAMAKQFGKNLGELVRILRDCVNWLQQNWNWIKLLGQAMLAVFVSKKILEFGAAMRQTLRDTVAATAATATKYRNEAAMRASNAADAAAKDAAAVAAKVATDRAYLVKRQAHYAKLVAQHAAYIAQINALEAANAATASKNLYGAAAASAAAARAARSQKIADLQKEATALEKLAQKNKTLNDSLAIGLIATSAQSAAKEKLAQAAANATGKVGLLSKAATGLRVAVAALGGPIGIITTALMLGIPAWLEWGNSGEKAIKKIRDALDNKTADKDTLKSIYEQLLTKQAELEKLQSSKLDTSSFPNPGEARKSFETSKAEKIKKLQDEIRELNAARINASKISETNFAKAKADIENEAFQKRLSDTEAIFRKEAGDINARAAAKLALLKKGSKEEIELQKQTSLELRNNVIAAGEALYKITLAQHTKATAALDHAKASGNTGEIEAALAHLDEVNKKLVEQSRFKDEAAHLLDPLKLKAEKTKKPDALAQALEQSRADLAAAQIKLEDLEDGIVTFNRLKAAAIAEVEGDRLSGRFNRKDDRGNSVAPSKNDPALAEMAENRAKIDQINRETQAQKALNRLKALSKAELATSASRFDNTFDERQSTGVHKLQRSLAALQQTLVEGTPAMENFKQHANQIISDQSVADLNNFVADLKPLGAQLKVSLSDSLLGARQDSYDLEIAKLRSALEVRKRAILENTALTSAQVASMTKQADEELNNYLALRLQQHIKDMRTPLQQLTVSWQHATDRMREASVRWTNDSLDALVQLVKGGKVEWRSLIDSILTDILRIQLQKTFGKMINNAFESGIGMLGSVFGLSNPASRLPGGSDGNLPLDPVTGAVMTMNISDSKAISGIKEAVVGQQGVFKTANERLNSMWGGLKSGLTSIWDTMGRMLGNLGSGLSSLFSNLAGGLGSFMSGLAGGGKGGILGGILDIFSTAVGGAMMGVGGGGGGLGKGVMAATSNGASAAFGDISGSLFKSFKFENGGIMSDIGALKLKKYSMGGIANSPQLALFGEGRQNEAYVPLPDGRSIPVTLTGGAGGAPNVIISITVNKDGTESSDSSGVDDGSAWNRMAQKIKGVVREELVIQKRPGGVLAK